jgi:hypothetical protein
MLNKVINKINSQGKDYKKFSNNWNVMQQLIDIVSYQPESAEIVYQDLQVNEMQLTALVKKITGNKIANPEEVMQEICKFYSIPCPDVLPPETWRNSAAVKPKPAENTTMSTEPISLLDLM